MKGDGSTFFVLVHQLYHFMVLQSYILQFELDKLLNGTLCLSPEIASSLERFWGIPASFWLSLQSAYEEDLDKSDNKGMVRTFLNFVAPK